MPHKNKIPISQLTSQRFCPSNATALIAVLRCVSGSAFEMGCNHFGKLSTEKNVPPNKNCGNVIKFAKGGIVLSLFANPLTIKPNPINIIKPTKLRKSISNKVIQP